MTHTVAASAHISLADALAAGPPAPGNLAVSLFCHGTLQVEFYQPTGRDLQQPHQRDELYVVARGQGLFFDGMQRHSVEAGSVVFVPARQEHRFAECSADFAAWVFFYGPVGGEAPAL